MELIIALVVTGALTPVVARVAVRLGVVDRPGPLKLQQVPVPYLGGVAVALGMLVPVAFAWPAALVPLGMALGLGLADDIADLSLHVRLPCEVAIGLAAAMVVPHPDLPTTMLTVVATLALINATNLLDGLDGLASGVTCVSALAFAVMSDGCPQALALALGGALLGFLLWNRPPARIFLGDAGSYMLGTGVAMLLGTTLASDMPAAQVSGALLFVAAPIADTTVAIVRRRRARQPLLHGDRGHVYDQLVDRGLSGPAVTALFIGAQAVLAACGLAISTLPGPAAIAITLALVTAVGAVMFASFTRPDAWQS